jgi:tRNA uridine 5-carboxymethylaminomethyl modification enzyme
MFTGVIEGVGPRYCPSIEDKIHRFRRQGQPPDLLEPEGLDTHEIYPQGVSTSLPFDVQLALVRSIRGLENCPYHPSRLCHRVRLFRSAQPQGQPGDQVHRRPIFRRPDQRHHRLRGSRGAGLAGRLNAARLARQLPAWSPRRDQAYLGVLVDDLITRGVSEPYRMFTSRAEYRLSLREDNADLRLTAIGRELGLVDDRRWDAFNRKRDAVARERSASSRPGSIRASCRRPMPCACWVSRWSANIACSTCCAGRRSPTPA